MSDETFREVADLLFGGGADELVSKFEPDGADLHVRGTKPKKKDRAHVERRQAQIGLASNVVGIAAGAHGTYEAGKHWNAERKTPAGTRRIKRIKVTGKTKALAAAALGLQTGNLVGDAVANRVLARAARKKEEDPKIKVKQIHKRLVPVTKGLPDKVEKSADLDIKWEGEISKMNVDKQQVFGWASIVEMNGEKIVDLQGDYISIEEVEKAGYEYVQKSRKGGDMHLRDVNNQPVHASEMIESFIVTPEKKESLGLPAEMPTGWWVGYQVNDPEVWAKVKSGERTGFSIHGRGQRS